MTPYVGIPHEAHTLLRLINQWVEIPGQAVAIMQDLTVKWGISSKLKVEICLPPTCRPDVLNFSFMEAGQEEWKTLNNWLADYTGLQGLGEMQEAEVGFALDDAAYFKLESLLQRRD